MIKKDMEKKKGRKNREMPIRGKVKTKSHTYKGVAGRYIYPICTVLGG